MTLFFVASCYKKNCKNPGIFTYFDSLQQKYQRISTKKRSVLKHCMGCGHLGFRRTYAMNYATCVESTHKTLSSNYVKLTTWSTNAQNKSSPSSPHPECVLTKWPTFPLPHITTHGIKMEAVHILPFYREVSLRPS